MGSRSPRHESNYTRIVSSCKLKIVTGFVTLRPTRYPAGMKSTASKPHDLFRRLVDKHGGVPDFSRAMGKARALVWQIYHRRRPIPPGWCEALTTLDRSLQPEQLRPDHVFTRGPDGRLYWRHRT